MNTPGFGEVLKNRRQQLGISLHQASLTLKLREDLLYSIESEDFEHIPQIGFSRAIIENYSRFLGIDPQYMTGLFTESLTRYSRSSSANRTRSSLRDNLPSFTTSTVASSSENTQSRGHRSVQLAGFSSASEELLRSDQTGSLKGARENLLSAGETGKLRTRNISNLNRTTRLRTTPSTNTAGSDNFFNRSENNLHNETGRTRRISYADTPRSRQSQATSSYSSASSNRRSAQRDTAHNNTITKLLPFFITVLVTVLITVILFLLISSCMNKNSSSEVVSNINTDVSSVSSESDATADDSSGSDTSSDEQSTDETTDESQENTEEQIVSSSSDTTETIVEVMVAEGGYTYLEIECDSVTYYGYSVSGPLTETYTVHDSITVTVGDPSFVTVTKNGMPQEFISKASGVSYVSLEGTPAPETETTAEESEG